MNGAIEVFRILLWACAGISVVLTGGLVLIIGILAFIGKLAWTLLVNKEITKV